MEILEGLRDHYEKNGISALNFNCKHLKDCQQGYESTFIPAKEALIGPEYGKDEFPKLLFISLDPGYSTPNAEKRTLESIRNSIDEEYALWVKGLNKNSHWWRTHEFAHAIFSKFKNLDLEKSTRFFAHINSAKCCINNKGRKKAPYKFFNNCKEFIPEEVRILDPQIIITQGTEARQSIENSFPIITENKIPPQESCYESYKELEVNGRHVFWIHTYHPTYYAFRKGSKHQSNCFQSYASIAKEVLTNY